MNKFSLIATGVLSISSVVASTALANTQECSQDQQHYLQCDNQLGWYIGADIGFAESKVNKTDIDRFFQQSGLDANSIDVDDNDTAWSAFLGYQFNSYLALELGYLDLGERSVDFTGRTTDRTRFFDNVEHIYPQSAEGASANVVLSYPLTETVKISGKLGYFDWQGDYRTLETGNQVGDDRVSDQDFWYGAEINYRLASNWQLYGSFSRVKLTRDDNNRFALGLRYYFGANNDHKPSASKVKPAAIETVQQSKKVPIKPVAPVDRDADGVIDTQDKCLSSDNRYQVDASGCTVFEERLVELNLVLRYAHDSAVIAAEDEDKVRELVEFINQYQINKLTVYGHTSAPGPRAYNQKLSERRAASLANALIDNYQIKPELIETIGKGETELLNNSNSSQADLENRRVELSVKQRLSLPVEKKS